MDPSEPQTAGPPRFIVGMILASAFAVAWGTITLLMVIVGY